MSYQDLEARHRDHPWFTEMRGTWVDEAMRRDGAAVYYAPGNVSIEGDLDLDEAGSDFLFVAGDLLISGLLKNLSSGDGIHLAVTGDLQAGAVIAGGSLIHVAGNLRAGRFVYGHYNDGCLAVAGQVRTPYWISDDHDMRAHGGFVGDTRKLYGDDGTFRSDYADFETASLLLPRSDVVPLAKAFYTPEGRFDPLLLYDYLGVAGRSVVGRWEDWGNAYVLIREWVAASCPLRYSGPEFVENTQALLDRLAELRFDRTAVLVRIRNDLLYAIKELVVAAGSRDSRLLEAWATQASLTVDALPAAPTAKRVHEFDSGEQAAMDFCRNGLNEYGWHAYENADARAAAEAAQILQRALPWLVTWSNAWHTADTLVRLLLKLDRAPDAYAIVASILACYPDEPLLADIAGSAGYKVWKLGA
jgi:hypothetical protein